MTGEYPEVTDVQAGTYVFMDWSYRQIEELEKSRQAMTVLTTAISIPPHRKTKAYIDCGIKNTSAEHTCDYAMTAYPRVSEELAERLRVSPLFEEHGHLEGDVGRLDPGTSSNSCPQHCCTVPARCDVTYVTRGDANVGVWDVTARGRRG